MVLTAGTSDSENTRRLRFIAVIVIVLQVYVVLGALTSLLGWATDVPGLADWDHDGITIQPNSCVAAAASAAALILLSLGQRRTAAAIGVFVALIGASAIFEWLTGIDLRLDTLLMFDRTWGRVGVLHPGRIGPPGALSWALIGIALVLASRPPGARARRHATRLALIPIGISSLGLLGYAYGASLLYAIPTLTVIALQTATFIMAVSLGILMTVREYGLMRAMTQDSPSSDIARRLAPAILVIPISLGLLRVIGDRAQVYDTAFASAARTVLEIALFMALLWWTGRAMDREARRREAAARALQASQKRVVDILESITEGFVTFDRDWRFTYVNAEAERLLQKSRGEMIGISCWELFPNGVGGVAWTELHRAARMRVSVTYDDYVSHIKRWFSSRAYPTQDGMLAVYFEDVTVRKLAEAERDSSREKERRAHDSLRRLVEFSPFGIYCVDADFRVAQVSSGAGKAFENVRPLIGHDFSQAMHILWNEPFASEAIARFRHTLETGEPYHGECTAERRRDTGTVESYDWRLERMTLPDGRPGVVCHFYDLSEQQRHEAELRDREERLKLLMEELDHRVKNTLALVQAMAQLSFRGKDISAEARRAFDDRLTAIAAAHNILMRTDWARSALADVAEEAIAFCGPAAQRITRSGPSVKLDARQTIFFAMALHELCTNALKYGALSTDAGAVDLHWRLLSEDTWLEVTWRERGGPRVIPPVQRGFGTLMIEQASAHEIQGQAKLTFDPHGLTCLIAAPLDMNAATGPATPVGKAAGAAAR